MRTESIFAIIIKVVSGGAPQEAVVTTLRCTAVVFGALEQEGEFAELSVGVAKLNLHHCKTPKEQVIQLSDVLSR